MSPDCEHPRCHEEMKLSLKGKADKNCVNKMLPRRAIWAAIPILLALGAMMLGAADFKYAQTSDVEEVKRQQEKCKAVQKHIQSDLNEIKSNQEETRKDIKEILRHLRDTD